VQVVPPNGEQRVTFKTISPDGQYMIGTSDTSVVLYDLATGPPVKDLGLVGRYTQPDWSPDGEQVVFVKILGNFRSEFDFELSDLVVFDWDGAALSNERVLISSEDGYTYYYPAWSPDGEWLAYNRTIGSGYASPTAELMLASRDGLRVVRLDTANGEDNNQNSYPRWGPLPDDEVLWLAFSSKRSYPIDGLGQPQIWVSAIDPSKAEAGADPSSAPFWLPGQDTGSDNHLPFWWKR
jgi:Tol biopolymer transport system component